MILKLKSHQTNLKLYLNSEFRPVSSDLLENVHTSQIEGAEDKFDWF